MEHTIRLLSFVQNRTAFISHAQQRILEAVTPLFPDAENFRVYDNDKVALRGLEEAFQSSTLVVLGVESGPFLSFKRLLIRALGLTEDTDADILARIAESGEGVGDALAASHALMPAGATVFRSEDGFYSGFACVSGPQHLLVLPLDPVRIDSIIENGFFAYLRAASTGADPTVPLPAIDSPAAQTVTLLTQNRLRAAIVDNKQAAFVRNELRLVLGAQTVFDFVVCEEDKGERTQKEHIAFLARKAQETSSADVGAAVSSVFSSEKDGGRLFVFVAVADGTRARVAKVFAQPDESPHMLLKASIATLFDSLADFAQNGGFRNYPGAPEEEVPAQEKKKNGMLALGVLLSVVAALALCGILILFLGDFAQAFRDPPNTTGPTMSASVSESDSIVTTEISTDTTVSESTQTNEETTLSEDELLDLLRNPSHTDENNQTTANIKPTTTKPPAATSTTVKPTTTRPGTTAAVVTTKKPVTTTTASATYSTPITTTGAPQSVGNFAFSVKGYGHGVGMSQEGAKVYADRGWSYEDILLHYYHHSGISLVKNDPTMPETVRYAGKDVELVEFLVRSTAQEIRVAPIEALKAQVVAIYTYTKRNNFSVTAGQLAYDSKMTITPDSNIYRAVTAVLGEYVSYKNAPALTVFFARAAGKTVSSASVWGGPVDYLAGGRESPESLGPTYPSFDTKAIEGFVAAYNTGRSASSQITLGTNPKDWFEVLREDSVGYVERIRVGNREMNGNAFRTFLNYGIRSHCFTFTFTPT